jgi:single-strand DNA-binding protein
MNKAMFIGRLGRDPELRTTQNSSPVCSLRIATDESYTDRDGNKFDRTEWHTVVVFQRQAENCATSYLRKGSLVFVE